MKRNVIYSMVMLAGVLAFNSCNRDKNTNPAVTTAQVSMHLTDAPGVYDHVYIDIQKVEVTMSGSSAVTLTPIRPGVYDLMQFRNGLDTLLMRAALPAGTISQIRLILGSNNSVVVNNTTYALNTPSAQESGLKLNLNQTFVANGAYDIWIDFDAAKSIVLTGNGTYKLKPVVRAYSQATNGRIRGYVLPLNAVATVFAVNGTDTFAAIPNSADGFFRTNGMPAATYQVWVTPGVLGLQVYSQTNVQVNYATEVDLGTITLHP